MPKNKKKEKPIEKKPILSRNDQDMIDELDYEYEKNHKPYDPYQRDWDEA